MRLFLFLPKELLYKRPPQLLEPRVDPCDFTIMLFAMYNKRGALCPVDHPCRFFCHRRFPPSTGVFQSLRLQPAQRGGVTVAAVHQQRFQVQVLPRKVEVVERVAAAVNAHVEGHAHVARVGNLAELAEQQRRAPEQLQLRRAEDAAKALRNLAH
eukprot:3240244-Pyramimonas_sp.AAC.1